MEDKAKLQYGKMTETPVPKLVVTLSIPTIISMLITSVYNLADTAFVGQLGNSASGAVGIVFSFMAMIQATGFLFGQGAGSIVSRLLGSRDGEKANKVATIAFFCAMFFGVLGAVAGFVFLDPLVYLLGSTETIAPYARKYMLCILVAAPFMVSSFVLNNVLRFEGKASLGMIGMLIGAILNIILDPILMFVLDLGISGAGMATAISQIISFFVLLFMFVKGKTQCKIAPRYFELDFSCIGNICATGLPSLLRQGLNCVSSMLLNNLAAGYGDPAVAAMSIVSRIAMFITSVSIGIGQGFQPVSGFNYGAKKYDRVKKAYSFTIILSECLLGVVCMAVFCFSGKLVQLFRNDITVIDIGTRALRLQCLSLLILPFSMITEMLLQSTGKKVGAAVLSSLKSGLIFIPALLILSRLRGLDGIQEAQPLANVLSTVPAIIYAIVFFRNINKLGRESTNDNGGKTENDEKV